MLIQHQGGVCAVVEHTASLRPISAFVRNFKSTSPYAALLLVQSATARICFPVVVSVVFPPHSKLDEVSTIRCISISRTNKPFQVTTQMGFQNMFLTQDRPFCPHFIYVLFLACMQGDPALTGTTRTGGSSWIFWSRHTENTSMFWETPLGTLSIFSLRVQCDLNCAVPEGLVTSGQDCPRSTENLSNITLIN